MESNAIEQRLAGLFQALDTNGDGLIDANDYQTVLGALAEKRSLQPGADDYEALRSSMAGGWDTIRGIGDTDGDGRVTQEEFVEAIATLSQSPEGLERIALATAEQMIDSMDTDGDGRLNREEYAEMMGSWGATAEGMDAAFDHIDTDGDGYVTRDELLASVREFLHGDSPSLSQLWVGTNDM